MESPNPILFYDEVQKTYQLEFVPSVDEGSDRILGRVRLYAFDLEGIADQIRVNQKDINPLALIPSIPDTPISRKERLQDYVPVSDSQVQEVINLLR
jgi:hypothetical protein